MNQDQHRGEADPSDSPQPIALPQQQLVALGSAIRDDLSLLALLHDRELVRETLLALQQEATGDLLGLRLSSEAGRQALALFQAGIADIPADCSDETLDILAAEYADIYLNYKLHASPSESVWIDEDGLTMQDAMFEIRHWYARHGLSAKDWRMRTEDHLVTQLQFLVHLFGREPPELDLDEAARFLDEHLLRWIGGFAERVAARGRTRFYGGLATLTATYLEELRDLLATLLDSPRPSQEDVEKQLRARKPQQLHQVAAVAPSSHVPGAEPSW